MSHLCAKDSKIWTNICTKESGFDPRGALPGGVSLGLDSSSGRDWRMGRASKGGTTARDFGPMNCKNQFQCIARLCSRACLPGNSTKPFQYMACRCSWTCSLEPNGYAVGLLAHGLFAATDRKFWTLPWPCRCIGLGFPSGHDLRDLD